MSVFNRIAGTEEPKIAVWYIMMDVLKLIDSRMTFLELATAYNLSGAEQSELGEYLAAINAMVTSEVTKRTALGWETASATRDGRGAVENVLRVALLQIDKEK